MIGVAQHWFGLGCAGIGCQPVPALRNPNLDQIPEFVEQAATVEM